MQGDLKAFVPSTVVGGILLVLLPPAFADGGNTHLSDAIATPPPFPTMSLPLTPSPTPLVLDDVTANQRCLTASSDDDTLPDAAIDALVNRLDIEPLLDSFNNGECISSSVVGRPNDLA